jgi:hypothetical protein
MAKTERPAPTALRPLVLAGSLLAALSLSACSSLRESLDTRQNAGPCPVAASLYEASRVVKFGGDGQQLYRNIAWTGEITNVEIGCRYVDTDPLEAAIRIDFAFGKGPAATANTHEFRYFVTVTRRNRAVLEKDVFAVTAQFRGNDVVTVASESLGGITIPRYDSSISGANFEILVGFDLTPEELAFNREGRRFRLDAGRN